MLEYPTGTIEEQQPVLRWKAFGNGVYDVTLYDAQHAMISRRSKLNGTEWTAPSALARGRAYSWEVESAGQKFRGTFEVGEAQKQ